MRKPGGEWQAAEPGAGAKRAAAPAGDVAVAVALVPILDDNYVFVLHSSHQAVVIDPGIAAPVLSWLEQRQLELVAVLQTHHHQDHIGGTPELMRRWPGAAVVASGADQERIPFQTRSVAEGDGLELLGRRVEVLELPGHTRTHLAYLLPPVAGGQGELFCGDVLFAGGCGRLCEGTAEQMHRSLQRLAALPDATRVWCAHEYTLANLRWAASVADVRPAEQAAVAARLAEVKEQRHRGECTIPSTIGLERRSNLFLMAGDAGQLAARRLHKDQWKG
ncbi:hydroxyacylglutathione hydrolase [Synechococcus sp. CS-1325]|uniref:hydroxyacylglutathione hydrolase n=1 Tax=Synechococcus sp. CS-1325 TaxID=2847979 RepID=UPI000DAF5B6A|nr:hydroxyacylglutathione hydrolase [Synechococcus sp. CS-1325]MCT0200418.1 hydroxyacylglutathione hydrolase [Synechococcus sp. CS-1325]PZU98163.1 MAG: hydroxyacylglutathione hydrolase [Cyanobium sp.]